MTPVHRLVISGFAAMFLASSASAADETSPKAQTDDGTPVSEAPTRKPLVDKITPQMSEVIAQQAVLKVKNGTAGVDVPPDSPLFTLMPAEKLHTMLQSIAANSYPMVTRDTVLSLVSEAESLFLNVPESEMTPGREKEGELALDHFKTMLFGVEQSRRKLLGFGPTENRSDPVEDTTGQPTGPPAVVRPGPTPERVTSGEAPIPRLSEDREAAVQFDRMFYDQVIRVRPDRPEGFRGVANAYQDLGKHSTAVQNYTKAIERGGDSSVVRSRRSRSYYELGDYQFAYADAGAALQKDNRNAQALALYKLTRGRVRPSDMKLKPMTRRQERASEAAVARLDATMAARDEARAAEFRSTATMSKEDYEKSTRAKALTAQAVTKVRVKDRKSAVALLRKAIATDPGHSAAYANLASLLVQDEKSVEALELVDTGLEYRPRSSTLWTARAFANNKRGKFDDGLRDASNAIRYEPKNGYGWFQRAYAKAGLRDREASLLDLERAAILDRSFRSKLQQAKNMPEDSDPLLLYDAMLADERGVARAPQAPRPPWVYLVFGLLAAGFAAIGLKLQPVRERLSTAFLLKRGAKSGEGSQEVYPDSGFWKGYQIKREIAAGGMGVVYEAVDTQLDRRVAIKCMRDEIKNDPRERERFLAEARLVAKLRHPSIVAINGIEEDGGDVYLVFEYVEGRTLYDAIVDKGKLSMIEVRDLFKEVCSALEFAHSKNVVHRDLKPANIMITVAGEVKVMDFGVARQAQEALEKLALTNTVVGTPPYMSPEQEEGLVGKAADVYALGVCLYEALSGAQPFVGTYAGQLLQKREGKFKPLTRVVQGLPAGVDALLAGALHPDPQKRIGSAREFYDRLAAIGGDASTPPPAARV